jgi:uncharacterized protein (DUF2164 family)
VEEMAIELRKEQRKDAIQSLEQHLREELETEVGEMQAGFLLDYFLKEIAPVVYNQGVVDAQRYFIALARGPDLHSLRGGVRILVPSNEALMKKAAN